MNERNPKKAFTRVGFALLAGAAVSAFASWLLFMPLSSEEALSAFANRFGLSAVLLMTYVPQFFYLLTFWLIVRGMPKLEWEKEGLNLRTMVQLFLMMYGISTIINFAGQTFSQAATGSGSEALEMINTVVSTKLLGGILIPVLLGPIVEELIFRKLMLDRIRGYGEKTAIVFSALCFGLFHGNLVQFLFAFSVGLFLGYVYCKTGKVVITMIMHILLNSIGTSMMLIAPMVQSGGGEGNLAAVAALAGSFVLIGSMVIAGIVLLIRWLRKKSFRLDSTASSWIPQGEVMRTVYLNAGVGLFVLFYTAEIVAAFFHIHLGPV